MAEPHDNDDTVGGDDDDDDAGDDDVDYEDLELKLETDDLITTFISDADEYQYFAEQPQRTRPLLNKYEKARIIGVRAQQIASGAQPLVKIGSERDPIKIAEMELEQKVLPMLLRRFIPGRDPHNQAYEIVSPNQLINK